jgi:hypothetical protein
VTQLAGTYHRAGNWSMAAAVYDQAIGLAHTVGCHEGVREAAAAAVGMGLEAPGRPVYGLEYARQIAQMLVPSSNPATSDEGVRMLHTVVRSATQVGAVPTLRGCLLAVQRAETEARAAGRTVSAQFQDLHAAISATMTGLR